MMLAAKRIAEDDGHIPLISDLDIISRMAKF